MPWPLAAGAPEQVSFTVRAGEIVGIGGLLGKAVAASFAPSVWRLGATGGEVLLSGQPFAPQTPQEALRQGSSCLAKSADAMACAWMRRSATTLAVIAGSAGPDWLGLARLVASSISARERQRNLQMGAGAFASAAATTVNDRLLALLARAPYRVATSRRSCLARRSGGAAAAAARRADPRCRHIGAKQDLQRADQRACQAGLVCSWSRPSSPSFLGCATASWCWRMAAWPGNSRRAGDGGKIC